MNAAADVFCHPHHVCCTFSRPAEPPVASEDCVVLHQSCTASLRMLDWFSVSALCIHPHISLKDNNNAIAQPEERGRSFVGKRRHLVDRLTHPPASLRQFHANTQTFCVQVQLETADRIVTIQIYSPCVLSEEAGAQTGETIIKKSLGFLLYSLESAC